MGEVYLVTGTPGTGKTTAIRRIVAELGPNTCAGFFTEEVLNDAARTGFRIVTLDGRTGVLATTDHKSDLRVGRYNVTLAALETIGLDALRFGVAHEKVVVIDEIGPMQVLSTAFRTAVLDALGSASMLVGTIVLRSTPWTDEIKRRAGVTLYTLTNENREECVTTILRDVRHAIQRSDSSR